MTPYEAFFGMKPWMGLQNLNLDKEVTENIWYEEELITILEMEVIGDRANILDVLNAEVTIENAEILPPNKDSRNIVDHLNQSLNEDDVNTEHEVIEERGYEDNEVDQDQISKQLGGLALLNTYTSESESDQELEILEELEEEGDLNDSSCPK